MKAKIWVLATVLADENAPAMPAVFARRVIDRAFGQDLVCDQAVALVEV